MVALHFSPVVCWHLLCTFQYAALDYYKVCTQDGKTVVGTSSGSKKPYVFKITESPRSSLGT